MEKKQKIIRISIVCAKCGSDEFLENERKDFICIKCGIEKSKK